MDRKPLQACLKKKKSEWAHDTSWLCVCGCAALSQTFAVEYTQKTKLQDQVSVCVYSYVRARSSSNVRVCVHVCMYVWVCVMRAWVCVCVCVCVCVFTVCICKCLFACICAHSLEFKCSCEVTRPFPYGPQILLKRIFLPHYSRKRLSERNLGSSSLSLHETPHIPVRHRYSHELISQVVDRETEPFFTLFHQPPYI